jgi:hypothetical protein
MTQKDVFEGKVILIYLVNAPEAFAGGIPILNPTIEEKAGRKFIVGSLPNTPNDWSSGLPIGVALDQMAHYLAFSSEEDYLNKSEFAWMSSASMH